jgi:hypothetical protein
MRDYYNRCFGDNATFCSRRRTHPLLAGIGTRGSELDLVLLFRQQLCLECTQARSDEAVTGGSNQYVER